MLLAALRSFAYLIFLILTVIPWGLAVQIVALFTGRSTKVYWTAAHWLHTATLGAKYICGVNYRVQGMEHLEPARQAKQGLVLLSKHSSTWETLAYPGLMPTPLAYVFKRELLKIPFFGWSMARMDMIHIDRGRRTEAWAKVAAQGKRLAGMGHWIIMFPEGTRVERGEVGKYQSGGTRLAIAAGVAVVPIAHSAAKCWPRKSFLLHPGTVDISIGRPIPSEGRDPNELMAEVQAWIEAEMRRLDPEAYDKR